MHRISCNCEQEQIYTCGSADDRSIYGKTKLRPGRQCIIAFSLIIQALRDKEEPGYEAT